MAESKDLKRLLRLCTPTLANALLRGVKDATLRHHESTDFEHVLYAVIGGEPCDVHTIFHYFDVPMEQVKLQLRRTLGGLPRKTSAGQTALSQSLIHALESAWGHASKWRQQKIRTGNLLVSYLSKNEDDDSYLLRLLRPINLSELQMEYPSVIEASSENKEAEIQTDPDKAKDQSAQIPELVGSTGVAEAISKYCRDITELARNGNIDPVFGRDHEVQKVLDILARRKKNNPILVGEPGVGKTAIVHGLAHRIVKKDVPRSFQNARLVEVDLGLLQAGAGVKGEFENRLKQLIDEVRTSTQLTILFIDEAHNLIGAGGSSGAGDAANLLKPALAAGELRSIAATTWSEYHKYIEKDPALERRFQPILVSEPSVDDALKILRGSKESYEKTFGVRILDEALIAAVDFGSRYIAGRFLPDVAFDLIDTSGARIKNIMESKPSEIDLIEREIIDFDKAIGSLKLEMQEGRPAMQKLIEQKLSLKHEAESKLKSLNEKWQKEKSLIDDLQITRQEMLVQSEMIEKLQLNPVNDPNLSDQMFQANSELERLKDKSEQTLSDLLKVQASKPLLRTEVDRSIVATVVSDLTGIPIERVEAQSGEIIRMLPEQLKTSIQGQDHAIDEICDALANYQAGINDPDAPIGVFLFLGSSGTGKTYLAEMISQFVFGGEHHLCKINMSEYSESHTVSRLIGSPPGYVGYGEGGVLTEAVRQRPYSVVLLDEIEKAARQVWELFYEVFDKGEMRDGEGKPINFRNTLIILTSNIGENILLDWFENQKRKIDSDKIPTITKSLREYAEQHIPVALLNRMKIVPFLPLELNSLNKIIQLTLTKLQHRLLSRRQIDVVWEEDFITYILDRCESVNVGARLINQIIEKDVLPKLAKTFLQVKESGIKPTTAILGIHDSRVRVGMMSEQTESSAKEETAVND
ncbi:type VI secretion system ATPase TssH [bacterium]|nr:type VI secretion system ATPase TssH [candidate division CSSED10-310 bacterium]